MKTYLVELNGIDLLFIYNALNSVLSDREKTGLDNFETHLYLDGAKAKIAKFIPEHILAVSERAMHLARAGLNDEDISIDLKDHEKEIKDFVLGNE